MTTLRDRLRFGSLNRDTQRGGALLSVLMALVIGGVLMAIITTTLGSSIQRMNIFVRAADVRDLRLHLAVSVDCQATKNMYASCSQPYVSLIGRAGNVLVKTYTSSNVTRIGDYSVRAACKAGKLDIEYSWQRMPWVDLYTEKAPFSCKL